MARATNDCVRHPIVHADPSTTGFRLYTWRDSSKAVAQIRPLSRILRLPTLGDNKRASHSTAGSNRSNICRPTMLKTACAEGGGSGRRRPPPFPLEMNTVFELLIVIYTWVVPTRKGSFRIVREMTPSKNVQRTF